MDHPSLSKWFSSGDSVVIDFTTQKAIDPSEIYPIICPAVAAVGGVYYECSLYEGHDFPLHMTARNETFWFSLHVSPDDERALPEESVASDQ